MAHPTIQATCKSKHGGKTKITTTRGDRRAQHLIDSSKYQIHAFFVKPSRLGPTLQFKLNPQ